MVRDLGDEDVIEPLASELICDVHADHDGTIVGRDSHQCLFSQHQSGNWFSIYLSGYGVLVVPFQLRVSPASAAHGTFMTGLLDCSLVRLRLSRPRGSGPAEHDQHRDTGRDE